MKDILIGAWLGALTLGFLAGFAELLERIDEANNDVARLDRIQHRPHRHEIAFPDPGTPSKWTEGASDA